MLVSPKAVPLTKRFIARLMVVNHTGEGKGEIRVGYKPFVDCHMAHVPCNFSALLKTIDKKTKKVEVEKPEAIGKGALAIVEMTPLKQL